MSASPWPIARLGDLIESAHAGRSVNGDDEPAGIGEVGVLKTSAVLGGLFRPNENKRVALADRDQVRVPVTRGTVLVNRSNTIQLVGSSAVVRSDHPGLYLPDKLWALTPADGVDVEWLHACISQPSTRRAIRESASGSSAGMKNVSKARFLALTVAVPPLSEQRKIAEILRTWDDAIDRRVSTRARLLDRNDALRVSLTSPTRSDTWKEVALSEIATRITRPSDGEAHEVMTISSRTGFVAQSSKYVRDMAGKALATYTLLRAGEFAYNKGNSTTYPQGCIYPLEEPSALVPSVYVSFALDASLNHRFYAHYFASGRLNPQLAKHITSGARGNGLLNITPAAFMSVRVPKPPRSVQDHVARVLDLAQRELTLLDREIELLRTQKRGLMQRLLSGDIRVSLHEDGEP